MKSLSPKLVVIGLVAVLALVAVALAIDTPSNTRSLDIVALVHEIQDGNVAKIMRKVKPAEHAADVLTALV